jgi:protein-tyrosine-phosphatase
VAFANGSLRCCIDTNLVKPPPTLIVSVSPRYHFWNRHPTRLALGPMPRGEDGSVSPTQTRSTSHFQILFICTGNRCRSPVAEAFVRQQSGDLPVEVHSAGILELGSAGAAPEMLVVAGHYGLDLTAHRSRSLSTLPPPFPDLVLGFERMHAAAAVVEAHCPPERVFTLIEIVRLLEGVTAPPESDPVERAHSMVVQAHEARRNSPTFVPGEDISDPYGGPRNGYVDMTLQVRELCTKLLMGLFGPQRLPTPGLVQD